MVPLLQLPQCFGEDCLAGLARGGIAGCASSDWRPPAWPRLECSLADASSPPLRSEVMADMETPLSAFLKVRRGSYSFLLESVEGAERVARYR